MGRGEPRRQREVRSVAGRARPSPRARPRPVARQAARRPGRAHPRRAPRPARGGDLRALPRRPRHHEAAPVRGRLEGGAPAVLPRRALLRPAPALLPARRVVRPDRPGGRRTAGELRGHPDRQAPHPAQLRGLLVHVLVHERAVEEADRRLLGLRGHDRLRDRPHHGRGARTGGPGRHRRVFLRRPRRVHGRPPPQRQGPHDVRRHLQHPVHRPHPRGVHRWRLRRLRLPHRPARTCPCAGAGAPRTVSSPPPQAPGATTCARATAPSTPTPPPPWRPWRACCARAGPPPTSWIRARPPCWAPHCPPWRTTRAPLLVEALQAGLPTGA